MSGGEYETILIEKGDGITWVIFNRPEKRNAMYYAITGDSFDGLHAARIGFVTRAVPAALLRHETVALARTLMDKNPMALRYTKEAIRAVRHMTVDEAQDYLRAKLDALKFADKQGGSEAGMKQFLDDKSYRPGFEPYRRESGSGRGDQ